MRLPSAPAFCLIALGIGCGGDNGGSIDASGTDALTGFTACPPTDDLDCSASTQICVVSGPFGPTNMSACEPVPVGCEKDRTCSCVAATVCAVTDACSEPADNTVFCDNGSQ